MWYRHCSDNTIHEHNWSQWFHVTVFCQLKVFEAIIKRKYTFLALLAKGQRAYVMVGCPSSVRPSVRPTVVRPSGVNNFGVATITQTNFIRSVSNFENRKVPRKYRSSSNMSKIGQPELGYLPLNFFNFSHFWGVATITRTNIIRSVSNFGNRKVPRKYRSSSNMSKIGQPELGYLPLNFSNFFPFSRCCNNNSNKYYPICFKLWE